MLAVAALGLAGGASAAPATASAASLDVSQAQARMAALAIPFEANQGQYPAPVAFAARSLGSTLFVTSDGQLVHSFAGLSDNPIQKAAKVREAAPAPTAPGWTLVETLVDAEISVPQAGTMASTRISRFNGNSAHTDIATVHDVQLGQRWPGIEVTLKAYGDNVEKIFAVAPGADPQRIGVKVGGAQALSIADDGSLQVTTGNGLIAFTAPIAWQENAHGQREAVEVGYRLNADHQYGFALAHYDRARTLWIDPLLQSTYLGGTGESGINDMALARDGSSDVYVAGYTNSVNFPGTTGGAQPAHAGGGRDAFVARLSPDLTQLRQATYLGGSSWDTVEGIAIGSSGDVYVAGNTSSADFPGTSGGAQATWAGQTDAFVARLNGTLTTLTQATYLGGGAWEYAKAIAVSTSGEIHIAGVTESADFPVDADAAQPALGGSGDVFVARLSADLTTRLQSTYVGGSAIDYPTGIGIGSSGDIYVSGTTGSIDFPGVGGGAQNTHAGGGEDVFVVRLSGNLKTLMQSTYFGGSGDEHIECDGGSAVAVSAAGDVYVSGVTGSADLPGTAGGAQPSLQGSNDAFVARLSADLTSLQQSTYLGGSTGFEYACTVALHASGDVYAAGFTNSIDFPGTAGGAQATFGGSGDAFVARLNANLTSLQQSSYLGGASAEKSNTVVQSPGADVYVAGYTESVDFPGTAGGYQPISSGGTSSGFISRLTSDLRAIAAPTRPVTTVPALSQWSLLLLMGLLLGLSGLQLRRMG